MWSLWKLSKSIYKHATAIGMQLALPEFCSFMGFAFDELQTGLMGFEGPGETGLATLADVVHTTV